MSLSTRDIDGLVYGLNVLYIFITKSVLIFLLAFLFNLEQELILLFIFFNICRFFAGGIHLKNSGACLFVSASVFLLISLLIKVLFFNDMFLFLYVFILLSFIFYSPADTKKKPIINQYKRNELKICSITICILFFCISTLITNKIVILAMLFSCLFESILILPITYKIFNEQYGNYKYFKWKEVYYDKYFCKYYI